MNVYDVTVLCSVSNYQYYEMKANSICYYSNGLAHHTQVVFMHFHEYFHLIIFVEYWLETFLLSILVYSF